MREAYGAMAVVTAAAVMIGCGAASALREPDNDAGAPPCSTNADCPSDEYCRKPDGQCGARGACTRRRPVLPDGSSLNCSDIVVCGCDGQFYSDPCAAAAAGVSSGQNCVRANCNASQVRCRAAPPECPEGQLPSVIGHCWGPCVTRLSCGG